MERDGLQKSLKVLQEEYQSVAKEAKVFRYTEVNNFFPQYLTVNSHLIFPVTITDVGNWRCEIHSELQKANVWSSVL